MYLYIRTCISTASLCPFLWLILFFAHRRAWWKVKCHRLTPVFVFGGVGGSRIFPFLKDILSLKRSATRKSVLLFSLTLKRKWNSCSASFWSVPCVEQWNLTLFVHFSGWRCKICSVNVVNVIYFPRFVHFSLSKSTSLIGLFSWSQVAVGGGGESPPNPVTRVPVSVFWLGSL